MSNTIQPGMMVEWRYVNYSGNSITMSTRRGRVLRVSKSCAVIKYRGKEHLVDLSDITLDGQPSRLTQMFNTKPT